MCERATCAPARSTGRVYHGSPSEAVHIRLLLPSFFCLLPFFFALFADYSHFNFPTCQLLRFLFALFRQPRFCFVPNSSVAQTSIFQLSNLSSCGIPNPNLRVSPKSLFPNLLISQGSDFERHLLPTCRAGDLSNLLTFELRSLTAPLFPKLRTY